MFRFFDRESAADLYLFPGEDECVSLAACDLFRDMESVSGHPMKQVEKPLEDKCTLLLGTLSNPACASWAVENGVSTQDIAGKWEHYLLQTLDDHTLVILGSDPRGTMWGIYDLSRRYLHVDPLYLWTDHPIDRMDEAIVEDVCLSDGPKTYRFRGWFINDEDLITGLCGKGQRDRNYHFQKDYLPLLERITETALRLRQNLLIPCSFLDIDNPDDEALVRHITRRGMFISMHHQEPVGVHQHTVDRWWPEDRNTNYIDHPERYEQIWRHYIRKWSKYPNVIWQLGLRGRGDQPVWHENDRVPDTVQGRGELISQAIQKQLSIVCEEYAGHEILSTSTLWMEGMPLYKANALHFPESTMIVMSDFGPDQMWGEGYETAPRLSVHAYGVYYHLAFWGCGPHLVPGNPLDKIAFNFRRALEKGDTTYAIVNVSNIREFACGIGFLSEATWDMTSADEQTYLDTWCARQYTASHAHDIAGIITDYHQCFAEMDSTVYPRQMVLMDGMCKRLGQKLLQILHGEELTPMHIQNKRLFDFPDTDSFLTHYEKLTREGQTRFDMLHSRAQSLLPLIDDTRRTYYVDSILVPIEIMQGLYGWVHGLTSAAIAMRTHADQVMVLSEIQRAADALKSCILYRKQAAHDFWEDWYSSDALMDLNGIWKETTLLIQDCQR